MSKNLVFIDSRVADYQRLADSLAGVSEVHVLDNASDGLRQMAAHLLGRTDIDALHVISHGSAGADTMLGGDGTDSYAVDHAGDLVSESNSSLATGGNDIVYSYSRPTP
jgi:Ca2+-binding RTX toxin-like protein